MEGVFSNCEKIEKIENIDQADAFAKQAVLVNFVRGIVMFHNMFAEPPQRHSTNLIKEIAEEVAKGLKEIKGELEDKNPKTTQEFAEVLRSEYISAECDQIEEVVQAIIAGRIKYISRICELVEKEEGFKFGEKTSLEQFAEVYMQGSNKKQ
jgi:hypothetical protein